MGQGAPSGLFSPEVPQEEDKRVVVACFSERGLSHKRRRLPCQDYSKCVITKHGWQVAVVADGVGSLALSELASQCAVKAVCQFWSVFSGSDERESSMFHSIRASMNYALQKVVQLESCLETTLETTLHLAILTNHSLYWGHCGNGGILVRQIDGKVKAITSPKTTEGDHVVPISAGPAEWECGRVDAKTVVSVLLATDGVYAYLAQMQDEMKRNSLLERLMNPPALPSPSDKNGSPLLAYLQLTCQEELRSVEDDITLALIRFSDQKAIASQEQDAAEQGREEKSILPADKVPEPLLNKRNPPLRKVRSWISQFIVSAKPPSNGK